MTKLEAIAKITSQLASLDDERVKAVAGIVQSMVGGDDVLRELSPRELALIEKSKADFEAGRTLTLDEAEARTDAFLARRRALTARG